MLNLGTSHYVILDFSFRFEIMKISEKLMINFKMEFNQVENQ